MSAVGGAEAVRPTVALARSRVSSFGGGGRRGAGRVEQVVDPPYALDRLRRADEPRDLLIELEPAAEGDDAVLRVHVDVLLRDASLAEGDALDPLGQRHVVGRGLVPAHARQRLGGLVGDALGDTLEVL